MVRAVRLYLSNWRQVRSCGGVTTSDRPTVRDDTTEEPAIVHCLLHVPSQPGILSSRLSITYGN